MEAVIKCLDAVVKLIKTHSAVYCKVATPKSFWLGLMLAQHCKNFKHLTFKTRLCFLPFMFSKT